MTFFLVVVINGMHTVSHPVTAARCNSMSVLLVHGVVFFFVTVGSISVSWPDVATRD